MHSEGYVQITNEGSPEYHYAITDHLGNTRLVYYDKNLNGKIESASQIVQENHYYPFGLKMKGAWTGDENITTTANNLRTRTTAAMVEMELFSLWIFLTKMFHPITLEATQYICKKMI